MEDCYFFLYSECKLKDRCMYRHNTMSKDNLITCKTWKRTKKCRVDCPLRHSEYHELKQRKDTMCYWEDRGGCTKYRCEYKHKDPAKDDWKEVKVKSLTEIINTKVNIENEIKEDKKTEGTETDTNTMQKPDLEPLVEPSTEPSIETPAPVCEEKVKHVLEESVVEQTKRIKKEKAVEEIDELDRELEELDELLK